MLDVRRIRVLCEVARHGSFSAAADALGYTQPAISRQIAALEAETGTVLVRRVPRGVVLTDAGKLLAGRGEEVMAQLGAVERELAALAGLEGGTLCLATFASAAAELVPSAVALFRARHPTVELQIVMADPADSLPRLRAGELDLALSHDRRLVGEILDPSAPDAPGVDFVHLFDDAMYVAMPVAHRLAAESSLALTDFAEEPWMLATSRTCPDSRLFLRACHAAGFEPRIAFHNDDYQAILGFVAAGVGVALIPDMVARHERGDVVVRDLDPAAPPRPISVAVPEGYRSPAAAAMLEVLREVSRRWCARPARLAAASAR